MFTTIHTITGAWATATELAPLLLVPAAVWGLRTTLELLDRLAVAVRCTYAAGRACGRVWFRHGLPLLLAAADAISAVLAEIDWAEVIAIVRQGLVLVLAAVIITGITGHRLLLTASAALGRRYAGLPAPTAAPAAVAPVPVAAPAAERVVAAVTPLQHPLAALADELMLCTRRELNALTGSRRRCSKAELVAAYVAA